MTYTRDGKYLLMLGQREPPPFADSDMPGGLLAIGAWEVATGKLVNEISPGVGSELVVSPDNKLLAIPHGIIDIYAIEYAEQPKPRAE